jgi:hypothetical protein
MAQLTKIEKYISKRLWNCKIQEDHVSSKRLMAEIQEYYGLDIHDPEINRRIRESIQKIRNRTRKQFCTWKRKRKAWADMLNVPEDLVQKWRDQGIIQNKRSVVNLAVVIEDLKALGLRPSK